jgi:hypothetical protein
MVRRVVADALEVVRAVRTGRVTAVLCPRVECGRWVAVFEGRMAEHSEYPLALRLVRCKMSRRKVHDTERPAPMDERAWLTARLTDEEP